MKHRQIKREVTVMPFLADRRIEISSVGDPIEKLAGILKDWKKTATQIKREIRAEEARTVGR